MQTKNWICLTDKIIRALLVASVLFSVLGVGNISRAQALGTIRYANAGGASSGACSRWENACELSYALTSIAVPGDQIWVQAGTYTPTTGTDRTISFILKNGVAIYGGFNGTETSLSERDPAANLTSLSGEIGVADTSDNSLHVVVGSGTDSTAVLDGFTITAGNATNDKGGGMWNDGGSPTLNNLIFHDNSAQFGAGMSNENNSSPLLANVTFSYNRLLRYMIGTGSYTTEGFGGGMYNENNSNPVLKNVIFIGNRAGPGPTADLFIAGLGGGMSNNASNPTLMNVTFINNSGTSCGGGMYNKNNSNPVLTNVEFSANWTGDGGLSDGGGMCNNGSNPVLTNVTFNGNHALYSGGGMRNNGSNPVLTNVTFSYNFANNSAWGYGGGMYNYDSNPVLTNITFSGNGARSNGGGMSNSNSNPTLINVTFIHNRADLGVDGMLNSSSNPHIYNSIFWDGIFWEEGTEIVNISSNPIFEDVILAGGCPSASTCTHIIDADPQLGPLQNNGGFTETLALGVGSPAIDTGNDATCARTDQRGVTRPQGRHCDLGAYEYKITFGDVSIGDWAIDFIERLYVAGITGGCSTTPLTYCPEDSVTRAQIAVFLERGMHGSSYNPPAVGGSTGFNDVSTSYWAGAWIKQLAAEGITTGCGSGNYCPEGSVTRAQMAIFLLRSKYGASYAPPGVGAGSGFDDVPASHWAASWIKQLVREGVTTGCGNGNYCPEAPVTRAQMAVFLVRTFNLP